MIVVVMVSSPAPARVEPGEEVVDVGTGVGRDAPAAAGAAVQPLAAVLVVHLALALCKMSDKIKSSCFIVSLN